MGAMLQITQLSLAALRVRSDREEADVLRRAEEHGVLHQRSGSLDARQSVHFEGTLAKVICKHDSLLCIPEFNNINKPYDI